MQKNWQFFEFPGTLCHHKCQQSPAVSGKVAVICECFFQRIVTSRCNIFFYIFIGIHQINEFAQEESDLAKRGLPFVGLPCKDLRHNIAEQSGHQVNILLIFLLQRRKALQIRSNAVYLFRISAANGVYFRLQHSCRHIPLPAALVVPIVLAFIIGKDNVDGSGVIGKMIGPRNMLFERMGYAVYNLPLCLRLVEAGEKYDEKCHVKG